MFFQYGTEAKEKQTAAEASQFWASQLETYLAPYRERLDAYLDRRVVGNLMATVAGIVQVRTDLTLTELGGTITGPQHAEAGTQRLKRALLHEGWKAQVIEAVLWEQAEQRRQAVEKQGETLLCIWDSSVLEKPESEQLEGLGAVRSSRVRRLARSRKGVFNRPSSTPVSVRGFEWESLLLVGQSGVPQVVAMRWWSREKGVSGQQRHQQQILLSQTAHRWGRKVRHVFDRGYGNGPWLWRLWMHRVRFVVRWKKGNKLIDAAGQERKAWEIARGKRTWGEAKLLWDTHFRVHRSTRVLALPVRHPEYRGQLWLVVVRQGKGREPWYLLTNEPVETAEQAWDMVLSYVRRWKIEDQFRFQKTELLIESLRLRDWEPRRKLLLLLTLAYGFLLSALSPPLFLARCHLLAKWCQRADWRLWTAKVPLYRLRWAERPALARSSSPALGVAALPSSLSHYLACLFLTLVDHSLAPARIFVLKLCFGSCFSVTGVLSSIARYIYFFDWELVVPGQRGLARISRGNGWSRRNKRQQKNSRTFRESNLSKTGHYAACRISQKTGLRALLD